MIRMIYAQVALVSTISLLAFGASTALSVPTAAAAPAQAGKKTKKHRTRKKTVKKVASVKIAAGTETLMFDTRAVQALEKAKVSVTVVSPATGGLASGFVFPLSGGKLNPASGLGSITATGGITLATSFSVPGLFSSESNSTISEPSLVLNSAPTLSFTSQQVSPPTFAFAGVRLKGVHPVVHGAAMTLANLSLSLSSAGVQFLSQFASGAFSAGEAVGTVTVQVTAS
ncbi:MAG TPA: hypothetical protein VK701_02635 [Solirubrobacteraceae bacterium]|jgi:hypothetical protein|nr:hypothetical protein [Solirubrobacteraceae bacterium]